MAMTFLSRAARKLSYLIRSDLGSDLGGLYRKDPSVSECIVSAGITYCTYKHFSDICDVCFFWGMKRIENKRRAAAERQKKIGEPSNRKA